MQTVHLTNSTAKSLKKTSKDCPSMYTYLHNSYNTPAMLYLENGAHIMSQEVVTQGDNAAMAMYAISTQPLIQALSNETANDKVKQVCFVDSSSAVRPLKGLKNGSTAYRPRDQTSGTAQTLQRPSS